MKLGSGSRGDQGEFAGRLEEHRGIVFKLAYAYCPAGEERDDLVQEICLQLWRAYPGYDRERRSCALQVQPDLEPPVFRQASRSEDSPSDIRCLVLLGHRR